MRRESSSEDNKLTSDWKLRTTSDKLKEIAALSGRELAHGLQKVTDTLAVEIVSVVGLDRVHECYNLLVLLVTA